MRILASKINKEANALDQDEYVFSTQLDVLKPEAYNKAMSGNHANQWSQTMREELDQLERNNTWELVHRDLIEKDTNH